MQRTITSIALSRGLAGLGIDVASATQDDMKMLACAQCHVEYYFAKPGGILTFPWAQGTTPADIERYYEGIGFVDWVHPGTGHGMIKGQHPEFETFTADSLHYQFGLACADCHMPAVASPDGRLCSENSLRARERMLVARADFGALPRRTPVINTRSEYVCSFLPL